MKNIISCEWCNHSYDLDKYDVCPKCGGSNNTSLSNNSKDNNYLKFFKIFIILNLIIGFIIAFIVIFNKGKDVIIDNDIDIDTEDVIEDIIVEDISKNENSLKYSSNCNSLFNEQEGWIDGNTYWVCLDCFEIYDEMGLLDIEEEKKETNSFNQMLVKRYYTNDYYIEYDNAKFFIPYIQYNHYNDSYNENLFVEIGLEFYESDYEEHLIDFYLLSNNTKYRIITNDDSFFSANNSSIKSINDMLKIEGSCDFTGNVNVGNNNIDIIFDTLLVSIDNEEFKIPLKYTTYIQDWDSNEEKFTLSEKIDFEGNVLYIDKISSNFYKGMAMITFTINSNINDSKINIDECFFEAVDLNNNRYRLYEGDFFCFDKSINSLADVLKNNVLNFTDIRLDGFFNFEEIDKFILNINGTEYFIDF